MSARPRARRELIPHAILVAALTLTAALAWYAQVTGSQQDHLAFAHTADGVRSAIESRLDAYMTMLLGGAGLFAASEDVTAEEFRRYVHRLRIGERYLGIQGIGFTRVVRPDERTNVVAAMRKVHPQFTLWPDRPGRTVTGIIYLEPLDDRNRLALGYDMTSDPTRAEAMERARDEARPAATGVVRLVQEKHAPSEAQPGFLIYVPLYAGYEVPANVERRRAMLEGFVYSPFRAGDLIQAIFPGSIPAVAALEVFDGPASEGRALHARHWQDGGRFTVERSLEVAGRPWTLVVRGGDTVHVAGSGAVVWLVTVGGAMLSVLLFAVTKGQVAGRAAAERRAEELRASEEKLRAADRAKDEFLATVSHELRTPLNAIAGWASILRTRSVSPEVHGRAMSAIARNAAALTRLVDDLLDMSRAAAGHLTLRRQTVDVRTTVQAAIDALHPLASEAGITLRLDLTDPVGTLSADPGRLQQIVTNLVSNAIKFTRQGGEIAVRACREPEEVVLRVQDTGIGIDPSFLPFLFDRFRQADSSTTRAHGGTGLGLAIVQHLVHLHGGSIEASSPGVGHGATFVVRLPDGRAGGGRQAQRAGRTPGGAAISRARRPSPGAP